MSSWFFYPWCCAQRRWTLDDHRFILSAD